MKFITHRIPCIGSFNGSAWLAAALLLLCSQTGEAAKKKASSYDGVPDFTKKETVAPSDCLENAMGTTGAYGWVYKDGVHPDGVTQIYVTAVKPGTPADGKLMKGDVILGAAAGKTAHPFQRNSRRELAAALWDAESEANQGRLVLTVWRDNKTMPLELTIPVVTGAYDPKAPLASARMQTIIKQLSVAIEKKGLRAGDWMDCYDALGLLATGDKKYWPMLKAYANSLAIKEPLDLNSRAKTGWAWGYSTLFLAEYYGATGDKSVLPDLEEYATKLAMGQSYAGTWNHCVANPDMWENDGKLHGRLGGYGAINQTSVPCAIALVLAKKVGVDNKEISDAIQRSAEHFRFFVDKGSIPYGDHTPGLGHAANGKNASTAVFLDLIGDEEGATFFSRMTLASYEKRNTGHTGHFFAQFWGGLGGACSGDEALDAFTRELQWYFGLERQGDGVCLYQSDPVNPGKYQDWSMNGCRLVHYCAPRKAIYLTGKAGHAARELKGKDLVESIEAGRGSELYEGRPVEELMQLLGSWSPVVRNDAAQEIGKRDVDVVGQLIAMLDSPNRYERYGACTALRHAGRESEQAVDALIAKGLKSKDVNLRYFAAQAFAAPRLWKPGSGWQYPFKGLGKAALRAANPLLEMATLQDPVHDPRNKMHFMISGWLFYDGNAGDSVGLLSKPEDLKAVDRKLLLAATRSILKNQNGGARSSVADAVYPTLTEQEFKDMKGDIVTAVKQGAPSGIMFSWGVRKDGLDLLAKQKDPVAVDLSKHILTHWGKGMFPKDYLEPLAEFGGLAKPALPVLLELQTERTAKLEEARKQIQPKDAMAAKEAEQQLKELTNDVEYLNQLISWIENAP